MRGTRWKLPASMTSGAADKLSRAVNRTGS
jgi:hypothetical protein